MMVLCSALNVRHPKTVQCAEGEERKRCRLVEEEVWDSTERDFRLYGLPLTLFTYFNYLGQISMDSDNDWTMVVRNLQKARKKWDRLTSILGQK